MNKVIVVYLKSTSAGSDNGFGESDCRCVPQIAFHFPWKNTKDFVNQIIVVYLKSTAAGSGNGFCE